MERVYQTLNQHFLGFSKIYSPGKFHSDLAYDFKVGRRLVNKYQNITKKWHENISIMELYELLD